MTTAVGLPDVVTRFLHEVLEAFDEDIVEAYLLGSAAAGVFDPVTSDLDVVVVVDRPLSDRRSLVRRLTALTPPGRDLELVVYVAGEQPPDHELNFSDGRERPDEPEFWFVLDAAVAENHSLPLRNGRAWGELFDPISDDAIRTALRDSIAWSAERPADDEFARLNAIRARRALEHGEWISKAQAREEL
jgi:predicted nucleotidyltransferase